MIFFKKIRGSVLKSLKKARNFILRYIINKMPLTMQIWLLEISSRLVSNPDFTWYLGKIHEKRGNLRALAAYKRAVRLSGSQKASVVAPHRQVYQFSLERTRRNAGLSHVDDPLFHCGVEVPSPEGGAGISREAPGLFKVTFKYNGVLVKVELNNNAFEYVDLLIDGLPFRRIRLFPDTDHYKFTIKRPALAHFPSRGKLTARAADGSHLLYQGAPGLILKIPHGRGDIGSILENSGYLEKKGGIPTSPEEISFRQDEYLKLYARAKQFFDSELGLPLFLIYGTLLGLYRDGDFIKGDDDFDVAYISQEQDPLAIKEETRAVVARLVEAGFTVSFNQVGRPFRLHYRTDDPVIHLDVRPVWYQSGHIWAHKQARLPCTLEDFNPLQEASLRGTTVYIPSNPEVFLAAYYGPGWRIPDPGYTNDTFVDPGVIRNLDKVCWTIDEYRQVAQEIRNSGSKSRGELIFKSALDLYPLERYEVKCGWF